MNMNESNLLLADQALKPFEDIKITINQTAHEFNSKTIPVKFAVSLIDIAVNNFNSVKKENDKKIKQLLDIPIGILNKLKSNIESIGKTMNSKSIPISIINQQIDTIIENFKIGYSN